MQQHKLATPIPACLQSSTIGSSLNNCNCHGTSWNHTCAPCLVRATSGPFHMSAKSKSSGYFQPSSNAKVQLNSEAMVTQIRMKAQNERSRGAQTCDLCATSNFQQLSPPSPSHSQSAVNGDGTDLHRRLETPQGHDKLVLRDRHARIKDSVRSKMWS